MDREEKKRRKKEIPLKERRELWVLFTRNCWRQRFYGLWLKAVWHLFFDPVV